jgi:heme o synthase
MNLSFLAKNRTYLLASAATVYLLHGGLYVVEAYLPDASVPPPLRLSLHLVALMLQAIITVATAVGLATAKQTVRWVPSQPSFRWAASALALTLAALLSGATGAAFGGGSACPNWPLCPVSASPLDWIHRLLVGTAFLSLGGLVLHTWRNQYHRPDLLAAVALAFTLFIGQALIGAGRAGDPHFTFMIILHALTASAICAALSASAGLAALQTTPPGNHIPWNSWQQRGRDLLRLTKPLVILLLLFTTYAGMVAAGRALPPAGLTLAALAAGALAAGGSAALNQVIDRQVDRRMARTARRPIAANRLTPAEGLAFGLGMLVLSFFIMARFANPTAAMLTLAGILYYLWVYSLFLKKRSTLNIVIGGGAGAIPPLVGWAAVSGSLTPFALGLFMVIFLWTPPHFWSLAFMRHDEYRTAGIPMLPVIVGRPATAKRILGATVLLVLFTWVMPILGSTGLIYELAAILLGALFIFLAIRLWQRTDDKSAGLLYRYSNFYLAGLFLAIMADVLI